MTLRDFTAYIEETNISDDAKIVIGFPVESPNGNGDDSEETISIVSPSSIENTSVGEKNLVILNLS